MEKVYQLVAYGFTKDGPYLTLYSKDGQSSDEIQLFLKNKALTLRKLEEKFCTGPYILEAQEYEPCPNHSVVSSKYRQCFKCRQETGFNPAFYNSPEISEVQEKYNRREHVVYIAAFSENNIKIGIAYKERKLKRLLEQGARLGVIIKNCSNAYEAREIEEKAIRQLDLKESLTRSKKRKLINQPINKVIAIKMIEKTIQDIQNKLYFPLEENKIQDFDKFYLGEGLAPSQIIDLKDSNFISGTVYGMIGDTLIVKQGENYFMKSIKDLLGYLVEISDTEKINEFKPVQKSLF